MLGFIDLYYYGIKAVFFFGLVHSFVKFETLQKSWFFLGLIYTAGVGLLSYIWLVMPERVATRPWQIWLAETAVIAVIYFKLLERFDEGIMFWILIVAGLAVVGPDTSPTLRLGTAVERWVFAVARLYVATRLRECVFENALGQRASLADTD